MYIRAHIRAQVEIVQIDMAHQKRASQQPTLVMPAVDPDPNGELPTNPLATTHERTTSRPASPGWVVEPVVTYDRDASTWRLAVPYDAEQRDRHGNTFLVHCCAGLEFTLGAPLELRADIVAAQLSQSMASALVVPFTGDDGFRVGTHWRLIIDQTFRAGDRGELIRG